MSPVLRHVSPYQLITMDPPWPEKGGGGRGANFHYDVHSVEEIVDIIYSMETPDGLPAYRPDPAGCQVWVWTTMAQLPNAFRLLEFLQLRYITHRVWVKAQPLSQEVEQLLGYVVNAASAVLTKKALTSLEGSVRRGLWTLQRFGLGQYLRGGHEIALLATNVPETETPVFVATEDHQIALLCRHGKRTVSECRSISSVLLAEKSDIHSEKPAQFYVDALRIAGNVRALDLFSRDARPGYESVGDQVGTDWRAPYQK